MKLLILTTATNRPDLHRKTFTSYDNFLNKDLEITWIINIDYVDSFGFTGDETKKSIEKIFSDREIDFIFNVNNDGWFNRAVRTLLWLSEEMYEKYDCILWLEDDWFYYNQYNVSFKGVFDFDLDGKNPLNVLDKYSIILLSKRIQVNDITLQPTIWSQWAFKNFIDVFKKNLDSVTCPETILEKDFDRKGLIKFQYPLFSDAGREWTRGKGLKKPPKSEFGKLNPNYRKLK